MNIATRSGRSADRSRRTTAKRGPDEAAARFPLLIRLFGSFHVETASGIAPIRNGSKAELLLSYLALRLDTPVQRLRLLDLLWPESDGVLAGQSLNTLIYTVHRLLAGTLDGAPPILHDDGMYRLNVAAGVTVDTACFDGWSTTGEQLARAGDGAGASAMFSRAVDLYRGDVQNGIDVHAVVERERLRARYLTLLAWLADRSFQQHDYARSLQLAQRLLASDPCREDAHRQVMRCHVRLGERVQALRQYRVCQQVLLAEFDATPEPSTQALFEKIRSGGAVESTGPGGPLVQ